MNRGKFTIDKATGQLVSYVEPPRSRTHHVISDEIPGGIKSMADSRMYTSKRRLRDSYRRLGKEEVGNDVDYQPTRDPRDRERRERDVRDDLERAWYDLRDNNAKEMDAETRERCKRIDHNLREYNYDRRERDRNGNL
jgi:hypothetical protein